MKSFFKMVFANIVAIIIIAALFGISLIMMIAASAFSNPSKPNLKDKTVLTLDFKTNIIDSPAEDNEGIFSLQSNSKNVMIYDMVEAVNHAAKDDKIKGISLETDGMQAGLTQLDALRRALENFKKSGKFVYAYGNTVSQPAYYLGSVADRYFLHPAGAIDLKGLSMEVMYVKEFADKYGIGLEIIRHGKYKSAVEPYMRNDMSEENREQLSTLLNDVWNAQATKMAASRKLSAEQFKMVTDSLYGAIPELCLKYKLTDQLAQKGEYEDFIKNKLQLKEKDKLAQVSFSKYIRTFSDDKKGDGEIGVLYASGAIYGGEGYDEIYAENFVKDIRKLAKDEKIKAVVLRINSPGGSANASDEILFELQELKKKKPLVVSFGDYAASGGYYIAMGADRIYSEPNTLTGSIGVFGMIPYFKDLANRNGIHSEAVNTNANSNMYSPVNGVSAGGVAIMTRSVENTYKRFVHFVTQNRKKSFEAIDEIGGGRVWSGTRAKELGLVDELGSLHDAIAFAAKKAKLKDGYGLTTYPKKVNPFDQFFKDMDENQITTRLLKSRLGAENYRLMEQITQPRFQEGVMMQMPFEIKTR